MVIRNLRLRANLIYLHYFPHFCFVFLFWLLLDINYLEGGERKEEANEEEHMKNYLEEGERNNYIRFNGIV